MFIKTCTNCEHFVAERCETNVPCMGGQQWKQKKVDCCDKCPFGLCGCIYSMNVVTSDNINNGKLTVYVPGFECPQNLIQEGELNERI